MERAWGRSERLLNAAQQRLREITLVPKRFRSVSLLLLMFPILVLSFSSPAAPISKLTINLKINLTLPKSDSINIQRRVSAVLDAPSPMTADKSHRLKGIKKHFRGSTDLPPSRPHFFPEVDVRRIEAGNYRKPVEDG